MPRPRRKRSLSGQVESQRRQRQKSANSQTGHPPSSAVSTVSTPHPPRSSIVHQNDISQFVNHGSSIQDVPSSFPHDFTNVPPQLNIPVNNIPSTIPSMHQLVSVPYNPLSCGVGNTVDNNYSTDQTCTSQQLYHGNQVTPQMPSTDMSNPSFLQQTSQMQSAEIGNVFPFHSVCTDMTMHISQKIKLQIWTGEYIELGILLQKEPLPQSQYIKITNGNLVVANAVNKHEIKSISSWTDAFLLYIQVVIMKNPELATELIQYLHTIRLAAKRHSYGWIYYDKAFRQKKAKVFNMKWSSVDGELWLLTMTGNSNISPQTQPFKHNVCYPFNIKGFCSKLGCAYQHVCKNCRGPHSAILCGTRTTAPRAQYHLNNFRPRSFRPTGPRFSAPRTFAGPGQFSN